MNWSQIENRSDRLFKASDASSGGQVLLEGSHLDEFCNELFFRRDGNGEHGWMQACREDPTHEFTQGEKYQKLLKSLPPRVGRIAHLHVELARRIAGSSNWSSDAEIDDSTVFANQMSQETLPRGLVHDLLMLLSPTGRPRGGNDVTAHVHVPVIVAGAIRNQKWPEMVRMRLEAVEGRGEFYPDATMLFVDRDDNWISGERAAVQYVRDSELHHWPRLVDYRWRLDPCAARILRDGSASAAFALGLVRLGERAAAT